MADSKVTLGENSPEEVAYKLFREVANAEGKRSIYGTGSTAPDRKWILDTYAECLLAVRSPHDRL